jgi:small-conductance mechanosensitive channel
MCALLLLVAVTGVAELVVEPLADYRILDLTVAIVIVAGAWWLVRNEAPGGDETSAWGSVVLLGLKVAVAGGAIAILTNVLGWTLLSTMILTVLIGTAYTGLGTVIGYRVLAGIVRLTPHSRLGQASRALRLHGDVITSRIIGMLRIAAFPVWVWLSLRYTELDDPVAAWLGRLLDSSIHVGILHISLASVLNFAITLLLTIWIARFVRFVLDVEVLPRFSLERGVSSAISTMAQWTILALGLLAAAGAAGLGARQLALVAGALGVGIGFGLQSIVNNFVSGLILIFEQPVKVGDKVEITSLGLTGEVRRIGIRASVVREFNGAEVIVPNANLISSEVVNWTLSDQRRRIRTEIGVAYGSDPSRVIEILMGVATGHPEVLKYPEPQVLFLGFGDSSLNFRLMSWTGTFDNFLRIRSELNVATHDALRDAGITIPFPQRDLHIRSLPAAAVPLPLSATEFDSGDGEAGSQAPEDEQNPA